MDSNNSNAEATTERRGPSAYQNWKAAADGSPSAGALEVCLYSDAYVTGEVRAAAPHPYSFLNALPFLNGRADSAFAHRLTLRMELHEDPRQSLPELADTDTSRYHGGWMGEEIAALVSLLMGIRLHPGGVTRRFEHGEDPRGKPTGDGDVPELPPPRFGHVRLLPAACGSRNLNAEVLPLLESYPKLTPVQATALVRAARLYQSALWVAEAQPELCWLFLVSAIEAVATLHHTSRSEPSEVLTRTQPKLVQLLQREGGQELVDKVAAALIHLLRATGRFIDFTLEFMPQAPSLRPNENLRLAWDDRAVMKQALTKIYEHRSRALHDGTPFPRPMCDPSPIPTEIPVALATAVADGSWTREDTPMLLHVFEYITRGVLLNWWRAQTPAV